MDLLMPRSEILRQTRAMLGVQTSSDLGSQVEEQHVVAVNAAAVKALQECGWVNAQGRITVDLQSEQDTLDYPENAGPGSVRGMAVFDAERYYPLEPRIIPVQADQDQQQIAGGETFQGVQGRPRYFEQRRQIKLWPYSDKPYKVRIDYLRPVQMATPEAMSIVDGMLVVYGAASMIATQLGDPKQAAYYASLYEDRKRALMAWQSQGSRFAMSTEADLGEDEFLREDLIPNWDRRPTSIPGPS